ncbi:hypothetical protein BJX63DRAFT_413367 [Aspergillus granulosus]|uniref:BZIP transcription factor n=1 Tax=Aspergillus granulosus TaxID=176169 RepID=A0ABR4GV69_9EURO
MDTNQEFSIFDFDPSLFNFDASILETDFGSYLPLPPTDEGFQTKTPSLETQVQELKAQLAILEKENANLRDSICEIKKYLRSLPTWTSSVVEAFGQLGVQLASES